MPNSMLYRQGISMMRMRSNKQALMEQDTWIYFGKYPNELGLSQVREGGIKKQGTWVT